MKPNKEQPLNVEIGKRAADDLQRRRDIMDRKQREAAARPRPADSGIAGLDEMYPDGFPKEWFQ